MLIPYDVYMLAAALRRSRFPFHRTRNRTLDPPKTHHVMQAVGILETGFTRIRKLVSPLSGLKLYRVDFEGPLVEMTVAVATEAHDDSGCPHTLEHLCFMGSHSYPHKGFLDLLATRNLANGTNAWTAQDHTAYTLTTAGSAGLLQLLPVYMDHILRPNITREAFLTEVHHINEKAENAGVVYCEMQGIESNPESMAEVAFMRAAFPPNSGYHYETGGLLQDIRQLTVENVRDFHKKTYNLANTAIIIAGTVDDEALCKCISQIEADMLGLKPSDSVALPAQLSEIPRRPHELFAASLPPFQAQTLEVRFPSKGDDEIGLLLMGWKGPPLQNMLERVGCEALLRYLTEGEVAPLHQSLLECDPPIASGVGWTTSSGKDGTLQLQIDGVEPSDLRRVPGIVRSTLKKVIKSIDMVRLHSFVRIQVLEWQEAEEENISAHVDNCITDAVYGDYDISLLRTTMESQHLLLDQEKSWWLHLMQTYFMAPSIDVLATPSVDVAAAHAKAEAARFVEQAASYGPEGLKACQSELELAIEQHQATPPPHLFSRFPVLSADGIPSIPYSNQVLSDRGTIVNFTQVKTQFVSIHMVFDTTGVPANIMQLMPLISDLFFAVDISASSSQGQIPWSKVVASLQTFSLGQSFGLGVGGSCFYSGSFETTACASIRAREDSAVAAVQWLLDLCNHAAPTAERIRVCAQKLRRACLEQIQEPEIASTLLSTRDLWNDLSSIALVKPDRQKTFLAALLEQLNGGGETAVVELVRQFYTTVLDPARLQVFVVGPTSPISHPEQLQLPHQIASLVGNAYRGRTFPPPFAAKFSQMGLRSSVGGDDGVSRVRGCPVMPMAGTDSAYLMSFSDGDFTSRLIYPAALHFYRLIICKGPLGFNVDINAAISIAISALTMMEGSIWRNVRGAGLAYGASMDHDVFSGLLKLDIYRSSQPAAALAAVRTSINSFIDGDIDEQTITSARCSCVYEAIGQRGTVASAGVTPLYNTLRGAGSDYEMRKLCALQRVTSEDVVAAAKQYLLPLVSPASSYISVVCSDSQTTACARALTEAGWMVRLVSENDVFGPMEDLDSEDAADAELLRSAMQLIDPELRSSTLFQHAQREVLERFG